jgi:cell division protein FtsB
MDLPEGSSVVSTSNKERSLGFVQLLAIIVIAVAVFLAWDFGRRLLDTMKLAQADAAAEQQLRQEEQTNSELTQLKQDVSTDDWVERYVRSKWHWTKDNETIFVPEVTPVPEAIPTPARPPAPTPPPKAFWEYWLEALFGPASTPAQ